MASALTQHFSWKQVPPDREGVLYLFHLNDCRNNRGMRLVSLFRSGPAKLGIQDYESRIENVEEAQGTEMIGHRTGSQFVRGEELGLVLADVLRSQAIGRAVEVLSKAPDEANVTLCGSLRVMTSLEFFQHHLE